MGALRIRDQYSRPLVESNELGNVLRLFGDALHGLTDPKERTAIGQQIAVDLRRPASSALLLDAQQYTHALDKVDARRMSPDYRNELSIGDANGDRCCPPGPNTGMYCTADGRRICDYDRTGNRTLTVAGQAVFTLAPQPSAGFSWWRPRLIRGWAHDVTNPSIPRWEGDFVTLITVGQHPVEGFSNPATTTVQDGVHFGDFVVPDNSGVPVGWPDFSNTALSNQLTMSGISLWQLGVSQIVYLTVMGNPVQQQNGRACRCNPGSTPPDGGGTTGGGTSVGRNYRDAGQGNRPL